MNFKRLLLIFKICFSFCVEVCYAQKQISLSDAIQITLTNNLQIKQALISEKAASLELYKSKESQLPNANFNSSGNQYFGRGLDPITNGYLTQNTFSFTENLSSSFILFEGYQKINEIKQNKYILEANKSSTQKLRNDLTIQVILIYLSILNYTDQLAAANEQRDLAAQLFEREKKRMDVGKKTSADLSRANAQLYKAGLNISTLENRLNSTTLELRQLMNLSPKDNFQLINPLADSIKVGTHDVAEVYDFAVSSFPEIKKANFERLSALSGLKVAEGRYYPTLSLSSVAATSYLYQYHFTPGIFGPFFQEKYFKQLRTNFYSYFGLNLTMPIFNGFNAKISVTKAKLDLETANTNLSIAKSELYKVVMQAVSDLRTAEKNYQFAKQSLVAAKDVFDALQKRYQTGSSSSFDFTQAQADLNAAQFTVIYDRYDMIFKEKVVDFYSGKIATF